MRFFCKISENREIEDKTADDCELNILICHLPKQKDGSVYEPTALASFASCLHSREKKFKMLLSSLGRSLLEETVPSMYSAQDHVTGTVSSNTDLLACEQHINSHHSHPNLHELLFTLGQEWLQNVKKKKHLCKANKTN